MTETTTSERTAPRREDRTVIVERNSGGGAFAVIGILLLLFAVIALAYVSLSSGERATLDIDVPAVSVDIVPDGQ